MEYRSVVDWDRIQKQIIGYKELDKMHAGNIGELQYWSISHNDPEWLEWRRKKDREEYEAWLRKEENNKKAREIIKNDIIDSFYNATELR